QLARALHTLKGSAATLGLDDLAQMAHALEGLIPGPRQGGRPFPTNLADEILTTLDTMLARLKGHAAQEAQPPNTPHLPRFPTAHDGYAATEGTAQPPTPSKAASDDAAEIHASAAVAARGDESSRWRVEASQVMALMREAERLRELQLRLEERRRVME